MLTQLSLNLIEKTLNHYLSLDPQLAERSKQLNGKSIAIEFKIIPIKFYVLFSSKGLHLLDDYQAPVDTTIRGTPFALAKLGLSTAEQSRSLFADDVEIEGDIELGQAIKQFFDNIDIDWEEQLSRLTGDVAAHQVGNMMRSARDWFSDARQTTQHNATEYVQEELRQFPPREEVNDFFTDIDTLRNDVDRIAARFERLRTQLA